MVSSPITVFFSLITKLIRISQPYSRRVASWSAEFYVTYIMFHELVVWVTVHHFSTTM